MILYKCLRCKKELQKQEFCHEGVVFVAPGLDCYADLNKRYVAQSHDSMFANPYHMCEDGNKGYVIAIGEGY